MRNARKYSPSLLSLLNYRQELLKESKKAIGDKNTKTKYIVADYNTAIHKALKVQNNQSVNIILRNMIGLSCESSNNFTSIFKDLVDYKSFMDLLNKLPF